MAKADYSILAFCAVFQLFFAAHVAAGELHRCRLGNGTRQYSDAPCPKGSIEEWVRVIDSDRKPLPDEARLRSEDTRDWQRRNRAEVAAMVRLQQQAARGRRASAAKVDPCAQARTKRDRIRQREFMRMTFERALALDDAVRDVCK